MRKFLFLVFTFVLITSSIELWAQNFWTSTTINTQQRLIPVENQSDYHLDLAAIQKYLSNQNSQTIEIPYPNGEIVQFEIQDNTLMAAALATKFPEIKTFNGSNTLTGDVIKLDISPKGFHAMIFSNKGVFFIDPIEKNNYENYQVYYKKDLAQNDKANSFFESEPIISDENQFKAIQNQVAQRQAQRPSGTELRTYRIAIAATGEYTSFHGGTVADGLAAIVTTLNRVNGIFEKEVAVTMQLVANNGELIYTDAVTDPFTNDDTNIFIDEVQVDISNKIGSSNFDIGHGFSTSPGGLAELGSVCRDQVKASGVTGLFEPIGDPYDVDYVAHEIGHQFGAPHTFNGTVGACSGNNRTANSAYEPGSGSTIMAYAGICGSDNIQNNSDPYFHAASLAFINAYIENAGSCAVITETGNSLPIVEAGVGGFTIPVGTPFQLNGSATDPDGHQLTYAWEQFDLGPAGAPNSPVANAPIFRSFPPISDSFRIFPQLSNILNSTQTLGEILPTYSRDLTFRLTVRDNQAVAGVDYNDISFSVTDAAGPFTVNDVTGNFTGTNNLNISWLVNNTDLAPVNAANVNIYLSDDGGLTFPYLLKENTPNDGEESISLPNINTATAKIKVAAAGNIFFNLSPSVFTISETSVATYEITTNLVETTICPGDDIIINISTASVLGYTEPINLSFQNLPAGYTASFSSETINPGQSATLKIVNTNGNSGAINFTLLSSSGQISKSNEIDFIITNNPFIPTITAPANLAEGVSLNPSITWQDNNTVATYNLDIATDLNFTNIILTQSNLTNKQYNLSQTLQGNTQYFVRINASNSCGLSDFTQIEFTTDNIACELLESTDLPVTIPTSQATIQSSLSVAVGGTIESVEVVNISGTHTFISDLVFTLVSPTGTEVVLLSSICGSEDNFNFSISDFANDRNYPCPPIDGGSYLPEQALNALIGEQTKGEWTLKVQDVANQDGGSLESWGLNLCILNPIYPPSAVALNNTPEETVVIRWTDNSTNESGFIIERSVDTNQQFEVIADLPANTTTFTDENVQAFTLYFYRIKAYNQTIESGYSQEVSIETLPQAPIAPTSLQAMIVNDVNIQLNWQDNAVNEVNYIVERAIDGSDFEEIITLGADITAYLDLNLSEGNYAYRVYARNETGVSELSNVASIEILLGVLSNKNEWEQQLLVFPNPTNGVVQIKNEKAVPIESVTIRNQLGQLIHTDFNKNKSEINLFDLSAGIYFIHIQTTKGLAVKQILVR